MIMAEKPTYAELEQRIRELEKAATERRRVDEELQENEENLRNFFYINRDFFWVLDEAGNIVAINETVKRRLGYNNDELKGKLFLMVHPTERHIEVGEIITALLNGERDSSPIPLMTKNGSQQGYFETETI